jgi:hypothetical protein
MESTVTDWVQWPAMLTTVLAAWLVGSRSSRRREAGFWWFLAGNVLWVVWGVGAGAYALIVLQVCLAALNLRGVHKNEAS